MTTDSPFIRLAHRDDLSQIQQIEIASGQLFREVGLDDVADHDPDDIETLSDYVDRQQIWVATGPADAPMGFIMTKILDGKMYIAEVSVHPDHGKKGLGRALMGHAVEQAAKHGCQKVTLSTFRQVPWNAPFYEKLGFVEVSCTELGADHIAIQEAEQEIGLDMAQRVFMWRPTKR